MTTSLIGGLIGPIGGRTSESVAAADDTGQGVDFAIGGLGFKLAISDKHPYERATAQFKKDQFDSAPLPGEQGLTGWWLRSQQSFHKGAGLKYYEVLDGETVLNRFQDSLAVDVSTPAIVSLSPEFSNWQSSGTLSFATDAVVVLDTTFVYTSSGVKYGKEGAALSSYACLTGGETATCLTGSPTSAYVGTSGKKIERKRVAFASTQEVLYTHTQSIDYIAHAKGRLWMRDGLGDWYALADEPTGALPVAIAAGNKVFSLAGGAAGGGGAVAETPGSIFLSPPSDPRIYEVTLDTSGAVPTIVAPTVAAVLPNGENVKAMLYYLGHLIIGTDKGLRAAVPVSGGGLTFGPRLVEWARSGFTLSAGDTSVYASGHETDGTVSLFRVDLGQQIGDDLVFAYSRVASAASAAASGSLVYDGRPGLWRSDSLQFGSATALASTGSLTTGYHRFGTLEPKKFHSVSIRVGGEGGTVGVSRVMDDGSVIDLYTVAVDESTSEDITLGLDAPQTRLALKFTLSRDGVDSTVGPELLGYQMRALPAPRRQRMIRVPLELFDMERARGARSTGRIGEAWARLQELEDMERSGGTFQFKDFRTGEAGECYIESVEHQGMTPPGRGDPAFGGLVYVTLRKL